MEAKEPSHACTYFATRASLGFYRRVDHCRELARLSIERICLDMRHSERSQLLATHRLVMAIDVGCNYVAVRHRYDPEWSANNYYTAWVGGVSFYVAYYTPREPVLLWHETQFS